MSFLFKIIFRQSGICCPVQVKDIQMIFSRIWRHLCYWTIITAPIISYRNILPLCPSVATGVGFPNLYITAPGRFPNIKPNISITITICNYIESPGFSPIECPVLLGLIWNTVPLKITNVYNGWPAKSSGYAEGVTNPKIFLDCGQGAT